MENHRSAAQRMKPILQAMERSIDQARRKRVYGTEASPSAAASPGNSLPQSIAPEMISPPVSTAPPSSMRINDGSAIIFPHVHGDGAGVNGEQAPRLKARPKRPGTPMPPMPPASYDPPAYRAQAS